MLLGVDGGKSPIRKLGKKFEFAPGDAGLEGALPKVIGSIWKIKYCAVQLLIG